MTVSSGKQNGRFQFPFFRRQEQWVEISGYRVGNIQLDEPIFVHEDAHVIGHVIAPKIQVAGLVHGSIVALETLILPTGQVWGDSYSSQFHIDPGGKLLGWFCAVNEDDYREIRGTGVVPEDDPGQKTADASPEEKAALRSAEQINVLAKLQNEAASALAARAELEQSFDQRLQEVAGETAAKVNQLSEEVQRLQNQLERQQQELESTQGDLHTREGRLERQSNELAISRELLEERNAALDTLREENARQDEMIAELQVKKSAVEEHLHNAQRQIDELTSRANSLETALQNSVIHAAEQEDALMRWQELAEATEKRAVEMETELRTLRAQSEENGRLVEIMQEQRRQVEKEWEVALEELEGLRQRETSLLPEPAEALLARLTHLESQAQRLPELELQLAALKGLKAQTAELAELRQNFNQLVQVNQEQEDQILWHSANLQTSRQELEKLRQSNQQHAQKLAAIQAELVIQQKAAAKWQWRAEQVRAALEKRKQHTHNLHQEQQAMLEILRRSKLQLEATDKELKRYLQEIDRQGQQLAEARNLLIHRDLSLEKAQTKIAKQAQTIADFKQLGGERIKGLQIELNRTKKQLRDATAVLARRQKRE